MQSFLLTISLVVSVPAVAEEAAYAGFRHVDAASSLAAAQPDASVVLLADQDFAPWSFLDADGNLKGISVDLAREACLVAALRCDLRAVAFGNLETGLADGNTQGIVAGPMPTPELAKKFALTRPYFRSLARFIVRTGTPITATDVRSLAGRKVGFVARTTHGKFLETYYPRSDLLPYESAAEMLEALRTGSLDVAFGDAVTLAFWLDGQQSRGCCAFLGKAFKHEDTFTRSLSFILQRQDPGLRARFDAALDQLELKGVTATIFARYLPSSVW